MFLPWLLLTEQSLLAQLDLLREESETVSEKSQALATEMEGRIATLESVRDESTQKHAADRKKLVKKLKSKF